MGAPTRAAHQAYRLTRQYRPPPLGSATSGHRLTVHGTTFCLTSSIDPTPPCTFMAPATPPALALSGATFACDDQGLIVASPVIV